MLSFVALGIRAICCLAGTAKLTSTPSERYVRFQAQQRSDRTSNMGPSPDCLVSAYAILAKRFPKPLIQNSRGERSFVLWQEAALVLHHYRSILDCIARLFNEPVSFRM